MFACVAKYTVVKCEAGSIFQWKYSDEIYHIGHVSNIM